MRETKTHEWTGAESNGHITAKELQSIVLAVGAYGGLLRGKHVLVGTDTLVSPIETNVGSLAQIVGKVYWTNLERSSTASIPHWRSSEPQAMRTLLTWVQDPRTIGPVRTREGGTIFLRPRLTQDRFSTIWTCSKPQTRSTSFPARRPLAIRMAVNLSLTTTSRALNLNSVPPVWLAGRQGRSSPRTLYLAVKV